MHLHHFLCVLFEGLSKLKDTLLCIFKVLFYNPCGPFEFSANRSFGCFPKPLSPKKLPFDVPNHAISIILKWCMSITSVVFVISLPSLNISATKRICGTSLLRLPLLLHGSDNVTDGPNSCPLYCHFSLFAFMLDHCLLHKLWWTPPVNSMNCTWTTFRDGSCFIDEHQGPCSPASTSQHIVSGIPYASCKSFLYSLWRLHRTSQMGQTHTLHCTSISVLFQKPQHPVAGPRSSLAPSKTSPSPSLSCSCSAFFSFCFWTYSNQTLCWCCLHITPLSQSKALWVQHCAV